MYIVKDMRHVEASVWPYSLPFSMEFGCVFVGAKLFPYCFKFNGR